MSETSCTIPDLVDSTDKMPSNIPKLSMSWRIVNTGMAFFFLMAACANANDDDWYLWTPLYLLPSALCFVAALWQDSIGNPFWRGAAAVIFGSAVTLSLYQITALFAVETKMMSNPLIHEEGREMGGLLIIMAWSGIMRFSPLGSAGHKQNHQNIMAGLFWVAVAITVVPIMAWSLCLIGDNHRRIGHCKDMFKA